jgi:hypothetical protein
MILHEKLQKELIRFEKRIGNIQAFADEMPEPFKSRIINGMMTKEGWNHIGGSYKETPYDWGIIYGLFGDAGREITNYKKQHSPVWLFKLYINSYSLFKANVAINHTQAPPHFFFDHLNTSFYATTDQIIPLLDWINDWYIATEEKMKITQKEEKKKQLLKQLKELERA